MNRLLLFAGSAAAVVLILFLLERRKAIDLGAAVGSAVVDLAAGGVLGIGDAIGLPRTDQIECERAIAEGRTWDASFACQAGTFIKSIFSAQDSTPPNPRRGATWAW